MERDPVSPESTQMMTLPRPLDGPGLAHALIAGALSALVTLAYATGYGALIFSPPELAPFAAVGIQAALLSAGIVALVLAWGSGFPFAIGGPDSNATAVLAVMAAAMSAALVQSGASVVALVSTVAALLAVSAVIVGLLVYALGASGRGRLVRYLPYSVTGGFLAGTGFLLFAGGFQVLTGKNLALSTLFGSSLNVPLQKWLPGGAVALALLIVPRFVRHFLVLPAVLLAGIALFYGLLFAAGMDTATARAQGMLLPELQTLAFEHRVVQYAGAVRWDLLAAQWSNLLAMTVVVIVTILLNATGLDLATQRDTEIDRELRVNGLANIVAGLAGGMIGYLSISRSLLNHKAGARSRVAGFTAAGVCFAAVFLLAPLLTYVPRPVLAGLLVYLGLSMLREWLWDAARKLPLLEYALIVAILLLIATQGLISGVGFGVLVASIIFVYNYSRMSCIKYAFDSSTRFSNRERPQAEMAALKQHGQSAQTLALQGFIFFGTANEILEDCTRRMKKHELTHLLLDFRQVQGLDISAVNAFVKLDQRCQRRMTRLLFSGLQPEVEEEFRRAQFLPSESVRVVSDIDHGLEEIETSILKRAGILPPTQASTLDARERKGTQILAEMDLQRMLSAHFTPEEVQTLIRYCETIKPAPHSALFKRGEPSDGLYFLERGELSVTLPLGDGRMKRLRAFGPGTVVGEMGLYTGAPRSADVTTSEDVRVRKLSREALERLERDAPAVAVKFHRWVIGLLSGRLSAANAEIQALL